MQGNRHDAPPSAALAELFGSLGDPVRLDLLAFLQNGQRCADECTGYLGLPFTRVLAHLASLVRHGHVRIQRSGQCSYFSISDPRVADLLALSMNFAAERKDLLAKCSRVEK